MIEHRAPVSGVAAFGHRYVATAGYDNQVILWDAETHRPLHRVFHDHLANQVAFSPDGTRLVTSSSDYTARVWAVPDMRLLASLSEQRDDVEMSVFHPERPLIATASRDHVVRVYDYQGRLEREFAGHTADVISVAWEAAGDSLVSSSDDGTIKRWSMFTGELLSEVDLGGVETDTVAITARGTVYAGNDEGQIVVIDADEKQYVEAHDAGIKRLVYYARGELLVSLSYDRKMRIWDTSQGLSERASAGIPAEVWPRSCAFMDADTLVFATFGSAYATYVISRDEWDLSLVNPTQGVNAVAVVGGDLLTIGDAGSFKINGEVKTEVGSLCNFLTPIGDVVLTGGQMGTVFDARTGAVVHQHRSPINCGATFVRNGIQHAVLGTYTGEGLVFSVRPGGLVKHEATLRLHANAVKDVAVSRGIIFSVCADTAASWFSADDLTEVARLDDAHGRIANGCTGLADGRFASVSRDYLLRLWSDRDAEELTTPHDHSIKCVAASDDGRYVATASYVGLVAVYDTVDRTWSAVTRPTTAGIASMCWDPTLSAFRAGSYDGSVYVVPPVDRT